MSQPTWKVPIVKLNKKQLVVDLGGRFVDLIGLENRLRIDVGGMVTNYSYENVRTDFDDQQFDSPKYGLGKIVSDREAICHIPFETGYNHGGRQSKVRRSRRLHRRVTRRTRR
jgi:hypothetical protein